MFDIKSGFFIGGEWINPTDRDKIKVQSPVDDTRLGSVLVATAEDVEKATENAYAAQEKWAKCHFTERASFLYKTAEIIEQEFDEIVRLIVMEQGKPISDAKIEVQGCLDYFRGSAEDGKRLETSVIPSLDPSKRVFTIREPLGVLAAITPWNFPFDIPCFILAPALAAGNTVVFKPAEQTPLCGAKLVSCMEKAGFPSGVINLIQGPGETTGETLTRNEQIDGIAFTGSIETGRKIAEASGRTIKHLILELGGNGPIVVLDDADVEVAAKSTSDSCFMNAGQVCNAGERILVMEDIHDRFVKAVVQFARKVKLGDPMMPDTIMGPLVDEGLATKVDDHVQDAINKGAEVLLGGKRASGFPTNLYYLPTVIDKVTPDMKIANEETFGPVCPVIECSSLEEIIEIANSTEYGLMSSVYTRSIKRAFYVAESIKAGTVAVNTPSNYWEGRLPWGGARKSGIGRQGGKYSLLQMTQLKTIIIDVS